MCRASGGILWASAHGVVAGEGGGMRVSFQRGVMSYLWNASSYLVFSLGDTDNEGEKEGGREGERVSE